MIGEKILSRESVTAMANQNVSFATSRSQVVDAYLQQGQNVVTRLRELAVQSADGTLSDADREAIQAEAGQLLEHLDAQYRDGEFNGQKVLQGGAVDVAVSPDGDAMTLQNGNLSRADLGIDNLDLSTAEGAQQAIDALDAASENISGQRSVIGADMRRLDETFQANLQSRAAAREAGAGYTDVDYGQMLTRMSTASIRQQIGIALKAQSSQITGGLVQSLLG
ncbi:MAG: hypothetical protein D6820_01465 [Lentisphaerae bacterium]|nr:MAG: hypothetical protein D6820_01465 [Lentisphaerota bacterium]